MREILVDWRELGVFLSMEWIEWPTIGEEKLTATNDPGRKNIVTAAIVIMLELSFLVSSAIRFDVLAISRLVLLSAWLARLKKRLMRIFVRAL